MKTLILGIGNLLMGDEGVGVHVVRAIENHRELPPGIHTLDGGTGGFHLLDYFQQYDRVILIDATIDGQQEGTLNELHPRFSTDYPKTLSAHDIGLKDLLDALYLLGNQPEITLFTVSIRDLNRVDVSLSPPVQKAVEPAVRAVLDAVSKDA